MGFYIQLFCHLMALRTFVFLSLAIFVSACSSDSTDVNSNANNNNNSNNGSTTSVDVLAKISRFGSPVQKGANPAACDISWMDSAAHEHSFLSEARGKVTLLCIGGLWSIYSNPMFN